MQYVSHMNISAKNIQPSTIVWKFLYTSLHFGPVSMPLLSLSEMLLAFVVHYELSVLEVTVITNLGYLTSHITSNMFCQQHLHSYGENFYNNQVNMFILTPALVKYNWHITKDTIKSYNLVSLHIIKKACKNDCNEILEPCHHF